MATISLKLEDCCGTEYDLMALIIAWDAITAALLQKMQDKKQWQNKMYGTCLVLSDYAVVQLWTSSLNSRPTTECIVQV